MKIVVGLGNPEQKYTNTRHNVGFFVLDHYAKEAGKSTAQPKFKADITEFTKNGEKVLLVKPHTYYNQVGESARAIIDFYKCTPSDVLIIHDDLALPLGTIRTRIGGSDGGNNGLKSLNAHLGADHTARIRVGVWTDDHHGADKVSVVLGKFTRAKLDILDSLEPITEQIIKDFVGGTFTATTYSHIPTPDTKPGDTTANKS